MSSVVQRIKEIKQPRGGYVNPNMLEVRYLGSAGPAALDHTVENVSAGLVGLAVDYLTRLANGAEPREAFSISLIGAEGLGPADYRIADSALGHLERGRVDEEAIRIACRLVNYDVVFRAGPQFYNPDAPTTPDQITLDHVASMIQRSIAFFREYGPVTRDGFTFEGGYTLRVNRGDGDFLTADTLWDFKVSAAKPKADHTLQVLMYYLMGKRSIHAEFQPLTQIGIFNPRLNAVYRVAVSAIPAEIIAEVEREVIGYQ